MNETTPFTSTGYTVGTGRKLWIDGNISVMRDSVPIRFAHHISVDKPNNHILHINNHIEIYIYISGDHRYIVEDSLYDLHRGDVIIISPREVHKALLTHDCMYERFYFLVDPRTFSAMSFDPLEQIVSKPDGAGNLISFEEEKREEIIDMLYRISDCFAVGNGDPLRTLSYFMRFLDECSHQAAKGWESSKSPARIPQLLAQILGYVNDNIAGIGSVNRMAAEMGLTPQYLSSYFSAHTGSSLKTFIQAKKITLAKDLLDKGADVTSACYECGFNECSYFIRVFKQYVGMTPKRYQQTAVKDKALDAPSVESEASR